MLSSLTSPSSSPPLPSASRNLILGANLHIIHVVVCKYSGYEEVYNAQSYSYLSTIHILMVNASDDKISCVGCCESKYGVLYERVTERSRKEETLEERRSTEGKQKKK